MSQRRAKGSNVMPLVKTIKTARKAGARVPLSAEDEAFIARRILVTKWYPFDLFLRLLHVVHRLAGGNDEAAMKMGKLTAKDMLTTVHRPFLFRGDPARTVACLETIWVRYFNFGSLSVSQDEDGIRVCIEGYDDMSRCHGTLFAGWIEATATLAGGVADGVELLGKPWEGSPRFEALLCFHLSDSSD